MSDKSIKVTDKRMFTPEGELRDEYRELGSNRAAEPRGAPEPEPVADPPPAEPAEAGASAGPHPSGEGGQSPAREGRPPLEIPGTPEELGGPGFIDLLAMLANPAAIYLGDAQLPDGESVEDLDLARWHIDLLDVLRQKTAGNLSVQELQAVEDLLYQLRLRYVQKKG